MKNILKTLLFAVFCVSSSLALAGDKVIPATSLPAAAQKFIADNFPQKTISYATADRDWFSTDYKVGLNDSTVVEFDSSGQWREIENGVSGVSMNFLPANAKKLIEVRFIGAKIKSIEKKRTMLEVELFDGRDLKFSHDGTLIGIDD